VSLQVTTRASDVHFDLVTDESSSRRRDSMCAGVVQGISFIGKRNNETIYFVYFPVPRAGSLPDGEHCVKRSYRDWIPKPAFGSPNQPVCQCRSILPCLSFQHLPILAGDSDPLLSQPQFIGHPILVGDWIEHYCDGLGASESELDDGSYFTSVFAANRCFTVC
jgi:hypothetical protein